MHGGVDSTVPVQQSEAFAEALKKEGIPVVLVVLRGVGHGGDEFMKPDQVRVIDHFLRKYAGSGKGSGETGSR